MRSHVKDSLKRLERLIQIKQTCVSVAEANLKHAESDVRRLEISDRQIVASIQDLRSGIAYLNRTVAGDVQRSEKCIEALELDRKKISKCLEEATRCLEARRAEWTEATREQRIIEKAQKRRSQQLEREDDLRRQTSQDDVTINRHIRNQI